VEKILSKNEVAMCQKIVNKELENNGYPLEKISLYNRVLLNVLYLNRGGGYLAPPML